MLGKDKAQHWRLACYTNHFKALRHGSHSLTCKEHRACTVNTFKAGLDKFWQYQEVVYDFKAKVHETGSRSCFELVYYMCYIQETGIESLACSRQLSTSKLPVSKTVVRH